MNTWNLLSVKPVTRTAGNGLKRPMRLSTPLSASARRESCLIKRGYINLPVGRQGRQECPRGELILGYGQGNEARIGEGLGLRLKPKDVTVKRYGPPNRNRLLADCDI